MPKYLPGQRVFFPVKDEKIAAISVSGTKKQLQKLRKLIAKGKRGK